MSDAVATHGLSKRYGRETALHRVDLRVPDGAVYLLMGINGAGKSTAHKVLMNLERPDAGIAEVYGLDTSRLGAEARVRIGYVPEHRDRRRPTDLLVAGQRSSTGREVQWTLVGEEREITARLTRAGAHVREVAGLAMEAAALALLPEEVSR